MQCTDNSYYMAKQKSFCCMFRFLVSQTWFFTLAFVATKGKLHTVIISWIPRKTLRY